MASNHNESVLRGLEAMIRALGGEDKLDPTLRRAVENLRRRVQNNEPIPDPREQARQKAREEQARNERERKEKLEQERKARLEKARQERLEKERKERERLAREQEEKEREQARVEQVTSMDLPMDWSNLFDTDPRTQGVHTESISDGLILSLTNLGRVDIEYIASITGADLKTVICTLKGAIYQNPLTWEECFYKGWETAEEYLSGNLVQKWKAAKEADSKYQGYFSDNVQAISRLLPKTVEAKEIYVTLGSPWVPAEVIDQFVRYVLGITEGRWCACKTYHDESTGSWELSNKSVYKDRVASVSTYGTRRLQALEILERTLNMKTVCVTDEVQDLKSKSGKKRVINQPETVAALEKQQKMIQTFRKWVWKDDKRREELETIFENRYGCVRSRHYDGSFLHFPGMTEGVELYPYQKNAVARILFSPNTLLAHDVGSGKTYIMIAAGMELRRMGLSQKNLYVVPNNLVGQWYSIFCALYPNARVLCVEHKNFTPAKRDATLQQVRDGDFDAIIMAYSCFERIELSPDYYVKKLEAQRDALEEQIRQVGKSTASLRAKLKAVKKALSEAVLKPKATNICFDQLGITRLFVDEAHNFKNVPVDTKTDKVLGISSGGSKKCQDMMDKVRLIQRTNDGAGVVFATGTPITNSVTDAFIMQKYLQSGELAMLDLQNFDSWIGMFAEKVTEFEIDVDTSSYRLATRFAKFHNLPELTALLASVADFHRTGHEDGVPLTDGYTDSLIGKTPEFEEFLQEISQRAEVVRQGGVSRTEDNMLKITTDGRLGALDLRLVRPATPFALQSKVMRCAENVSRIYFETRDRSSTQLIFCDSSTPKKDFNIYDEMKRLLMSMGVPEEQIAFIHYAQTEKKRQALFAQVRKGQVRILLGSTFKLGLGVNVQDKLIAVHHLDVPWRPADMTQREGRILRQGNENEKVQIYRYITEGSFDAYSWQLLETKQRFIVDLLSGSLQQRSGSDIEDTVLSYAEVKALAVGNPLVKKRVEAANELTRLLSLQRKAVRDHELRQQELEAMPARIQHQSEQIRLCAEDVAFISVEDTETDLRQRRDLRRQLQEALAENVLESRERELLVYRGFAVVLPSNMLEQKPYVWLQRGGRYYAELGDSDKGYAVRLDNVIDTLPQHLQKLQENLNKLTAHREALEQEKTEDYSEAIEACKQTLARLDKKLGVDKAS